MNRFRRPLAILLSTILAWQPALAAAAARTGQDSTPPASIQPVLNLLTPGGSQDKAAEQDFEATVDTLVQSLPPESVQDLQELAELIASTPSDPATIQQAREKFAQSLAAMPAETKDLVQELIARGSYLGGIGFSRLAIVKFKRHKDNPTQVPIGQPIALIFIAAALLFLPEVLGVTGVENADAGMIDTGETKAGAGDTCVCGARQAR